MEWLNENSRVFLSRGYLTEGVTPEQRIRTIAKIAQPILGIDGFADNFYGYMEKGFYSLSSPVWANFGIDKGLPISCFGSYLPDNMGGILRTQAEVGMMSKFGGGTSGYFGDLWHRGAPITDNGQSSGAVHFMKLFEAIIDVVSQSIEPIWSNSYVKDVAKLKITIRNPHLQKILETYGKDTREIWNSIRDHDGSVQKIDQYVILDQASTRQQFLDQNQSLNLMINPEVSAKEINELYLFAWETKIKTLYYQHSTNAAQQFNKDKLCVVCEA